MLIGAKLAIERPTTPWEGQEAIPLQASAVSANVLLSSSRVGQIFIWAVKLVMAFWADVCDATVVVCPTVGALLIGARTAVIVGLKSAEGAAGPLRVAE